MLSGGDESMSFKHVPVIGGVIEGCALVVGPCSEIIVVRSRAAWSVVVWMCACLVSFDCGTTEKWIFPSTVLES